MGQSASAMTPFNWYVTSVGHWAQWPTIQQLDVIVTFQNGAKKTLGMLEVVVSFQDGYIKILRPPIYVKGYELK